ncbi:GNAT family N-acetyltransferase [Agarivorans sp. B2Z047]|uniref:GNAT family N-acetyltransferase n=1 Tax=Agarivorans sp. B2Z047 TaxID=2652721 RepID=UPI00128E3891|nr:N-acetyltransferase [Agarivorans sp. B2Z047]MPW31890.1 GNAT family N-acetyltransferase [Agarivorans sp. B2Z047]UQN40972.1 N-acetyltransferase [Agarivorans sp. B2Z047]
MDYLLYKPEHKENLVRLFKDTFTDSEGKDEGVLLAKLVSDFLSHPAKAEDLYVFIATNDNKRIVGSIIFSRLYFPSDENVVMLAPVAVSTDYHGQGIGQELIRFGLETLRIKGVTTVITYGDINFYAKVGFTHISQEIILPPLTLSYPEGWIAQSLVGETVFPIDGKPTCAGALNNPIYW